MLSATDQLATELATRMNVALQHFMMITKLTAPSTTRKCVQEKS